MHIRGTVKKVIHVSGSVNLIPSGGGGADPVIEEKNITANGTYTAPSGVDGYNPVTVNVPTGTARDASDVTVSGRTVTVPAGLYSEQVDTVVAEGEIDSIIAAKTVSGNVATITPRVIVDEGYISAGQRSGTPVTVTADELASGTKSITANGNGIDVVGYASVDVNVSGGGGETEAEEKDVILIDYDGFIRYSYTAAEFLALSSYPALPNHTAEGLTGYEWNWSLSDAQAHVAKYGELVIGATYQTTDHKTHAFFDLKEDNQVISTSFYVPAVGGQDGPAVINWGDGSQDETVQFLRNVTTTFTHIYTQKGSYEVTIDRQLIYYVAGNTTVGSRIIEGAGAFVTKVYVSEYAWLNGHSIRSLFCPVVLCGGNAITVAPSANMFAYYNYTGGIVIPKRINTSGGNGNWNNNARCFVVSIPKNGDRFYSDYNFEYCLIRRISLPEGGTAIGKNSFHRTDISHINIPYGIESIGANAFDTCSKLCFIKFYPITPPTVSAANAFTNLPTSCKILVPTGTLNAYKTATNYPDPTVYTYEEY